MEAIYLALACWMIGSGIDDLWLDFCYLVGRIARPRRSSSSNPSSTAIPPADDPAEHPESLIALWIPAWREDAVIARMIAHNTASIRYSRYHIFAGTYPNDTATLEVLRELEKQFSNLHVSLAPHNGPTSKADNLNWIYQNMLVVEDRIGEEFDIVVIHDSEDLIHPEEFRWLNHYCRDYDFVQIPVLALPTPWWELTHGIYCDEFAETQQKDLPTRNRMGGFAPSCGVGTGYRRHALASLAEAESNRLFEPDSLTEDYLNGLRMHRLGLKQIYLSVAWVKGHPVATREFFPRKFRAAVRQRTRWVTGIALQTWQKVGWSKDWRENYWLWRDRKGLIGNPLSLLSNGLLTASVAGLLPQLSGDLRLAIVAGLLLQSIRIASRIYFTARVYGVCYALLVPVRIPWSNLVNTLATLSALGCFARARWRKEPLLWLKTEHAYPNRQMLNPYSRRFHEVLMDLKMIPRTELDAVAGRKPAGVRLGEYLVAEKLLDWDQLYHALSVLSSFPSARIAVEEIDIEAARSLPRSLMLQASLQPVRRGAESLVIATSEIPTDGLVETVRKFTKRDPFFVLVTPENLEKLRLYVDAPLERLAA
ncbi:glycosyl transferase family protein [Bryobacter aggregatus]|uniref:glycosyl transferase family protein n=1 Tax=Bryobacter aggregatus TaxID=360054 RepID=UPI0012BA92FC|nr:glycosyl transferase family protein [Bryobacter aggregatus]